MVVRMRHNRSQTHQRRSHHALAERTLSTCTHCGASHLPHHMCLTCGFYKGRQVMDIVSEKAKRDRRLKEKRERISVESSVSSELVADTAPRAKDEAKPKEEMQSAKGAAAKRRKDESESQESIGSSAV